MNDAAAEKLRQEREAFDVNRRQTVWWFTLKIVMGYSAVVAFVLLFGLCVYILLDAGHFPLRAVGSAAGLLVSEAIGVLAIWRLVLKSSPTKPLTPVAGQRPKL